MNRLNGRSIALIVLYATGSLLLSVFLIRLGGGHALQLLGERFALQAPEFVQARILVHLVARGLDALVPAAGFIRIYQVIAFGSILGVILAFRSLLCTAAALEHTHTLADGPLTALTILIPIAWNYLLLSDVFMPEDLPAMAFFTLGIVMLLRRRIAAFYLLFAIGTVNRESIILLVPAFLLVSPLGGTGPGRVVRTLLHCVALLALWAGIRWVVFSLLPDTGPRLLHEDHLRTNLHFVRDMLLMKRHAIRMWLTFGGLWVLIPLAWRGMPSVFRRLFALFPLMFAAMVYAGNLNGEARIWSELVPLVGIACVFCVRRCRTQMT